MDNQDLAAYVFMNTGLSFADAEDMVRDEDFICVDLEEYSELQSTQDKLGDREPEQLTAEEWEDILYSDMSVDVLSFDCIIIDRR